MKIGSFRYLLVFFYFSVAFFLLGILIRVVSGFIYMGEFYLPNESIKSNLVKSLIAGGAVTIGAIVFNLLDKLKTRKSPPSDQK